MKNLSVTVKLFLSYVLMVAIFVSSSFYVLYNREVLEKLSFWSEHTYQVMASVNDMMAAMVDQETGFRGYLVTGNQANLDPYKSGFTNFQKAFNSVKSLTSDNAEQQRRLDVVLDNVNSWRTNVAERGIALMTNEATREQARDLERTGAGKAAMDGLRKLIADLINAESGLLVSRNQARTDSFSAITVAIWASIAIAMGTAIAVSLQMARLISAPLKEIAHKMASVANGNLTTEIPYRDRGDEIGMAAKGLEDFRVKLIDAEILRKQQQEFEAAASAQQAERARMAEAFATRMTQISDGFSSSSGEVASASRNLAATAEETARQAQAVSGAAEEASANVQTVAASTEEMTASVREIASQVAKSASVANTAAAEAARTESDVRALSEAATKIGEVVELINNIAGQTNLLALNATIEAARAGEAGKGFAVVASEVKQLADQTAKATGEISSKINEIQQATNRTVGSIERIVNTVSDIQSISTMISAAIEEQGAATGEIASNTQLAARGTEQVSDNINGVGRSAEMTGSASTQLMSLSDALSGQASEPQREVSTFVRQIRAA
jgi:methyl-accepting chemotaxis protein